MNFDRIWSWPKPVQQPHPPIVVGGNSEHTLKRVVRYGDEWMPSTARGTPILPRMAELQQLAEEAGHNKPTTISHNND